MRLYHPMPKKGAGKQKSKQEKGVILSICVLVGVGKARERVSACKVESVRGVR